MRNYFSKKYFLPVACTGLLIFTFTSPVKAETPPQTSQQEEAPPSIQVLERFDSTHETISRSVVKFADWIDNFFAGDRVYDELQDSYIKLYLTQTHYEHDKPAYDAKLKAKLVLPKTQKRLKLLIESEDEEDEEANQQTISELQEEQAQSVGLRLIQKESELWRVQTDALLRRNDGVETIARLRLRRKFYSGAWVYRLSEKIYWYSKEGGRETTQLDIDHTLSDKFLFRSTTYATWKNSNGYFDYGQGFTLFQNINKRKALTYAIGISAITEDKPHTTAYSYSIRYREQIHKGWLFYEIIPAVTHTIENDFKPTRSISLKLEFIFDAKELN